MGSNILLDSVRNETYVLRRVETEKEDPDTAQSTEAMSRMVQFFG